MKDLRERKDNCPIPAEDAPSNRDDVRGEDDHRSAAHEADHERNPEPFENLRDFLPEVRSFDLLLGSTPCDVVRKHVGKKSLRKVDAEPPEKEKAAVDVSPR